MANIVGGENRYVAGVNKKNRVLTSSVVSEEALDASFDGDAFFLLVPEITLTSANESLCWLYRNDEDRDLIITSTSISSSLSTGGANQVLEVKGASGVGLTMTSGSSSPMATANKLFGSTAALDNTSEVGAEGASLSTPQFSSPEFQTAGQPFMHNRFYVLPKGVSVGQSIIPPASNTSIRVTFIMECYLRAIE